jgi:hypothetical protein
MNGKFPAAAAPYLTRETGQIFLTTGGLDLFANPLGCRPSLCKMRGILRF